MPSVRYVGPHDAVELLMPNGIFATVANGELLETTGEHAAGLLEQPTNWQPPKAAHKPAHKAQADTPTGEED